MLVMLRNSAVIAPLLIFALADLSRAALARTYLNCRTRDVVIVSGSSEPSSSARETNISFRVDEAANSIMFADGTALTVARFGDNWISASSDDGSYEFDRKNGILNYAISTTKGSVTTVIIGSGRCESGPAPTG